MKKLHLFKRTLLLLALIVGFVNYGWAETKTEGFESATATTTYNSTQTIAENESDCKIGWSIYYGSPSTTKAITGSNSCLIRYYTANAILGYAQTTTGIQGLTNVTFNAKVTNTGNKMGVWYSTDGTNWTAIATGVTLSTSSESSKSYDIPNSSTSTTYYIKIGLTAASTNKQDLIIDDVVFTYSTKTLSSIAVTTAPTKTAYKIDETVDLTGMVVTATYTDESTEDVTSKCTFSPANGAALGTAGNQDVTASYGGKEATQAITVAGVTGLAVKTAPTTVKYRIGDYLDLTGLVLTATYSDEGTKVITDFTASPAEGSALNTSGNVDVTLSYYGQSCTQRVTVGNLSSITYNATGVGAFANTTYTEKDTFNPEGLVITAHFDNDLDVEASGYTLSPTTGTELATSDKKITVSYTWNEVNRTVDIPITVNEGTKFTVSFDAGNGTYTDGDKTETEYQGGVTLPSATSTKSGWAFVGWATSEISNTTTRPTLYTAESTYYPTANITLYAVYALEDAINKYAMATSNSDIVDGAKVVISSLGNNKYTLANNNGTLTAISNFTPTNDVITCENTQAIWTLAISNGNVTIANGGKYLKRSSTTVSVDANTYNWTINESNLVDDRFLVKDASTNHYLEHNGTSWIAYSLSGSPTSSGTTNYYGLTIYVEKANKYDSNPTALITPTVEFDSTDPVTLYLDGTKTNTNTATVEGVSKTINYSSSNTSVATVSSEGVVTAVATGTATITASVDAELGVSTSASDTYEVTVKNTTTLAGIKTLATSSTAVDYTADLASDLVITYVNGSHAYLQSGNVAVYASCATGDWEAGKKFTGAISGKVRKYYSEYQITALDQTPVSGGVIPDAIEVAITDLTTANYATYEGRKIAINGATISTAMTSSQNSGGQITTDGTNTLNIYAREKGIALTKDEKGNFVGYIGRYNDGIRYYMYEQSQFTKTHNAPVNQVMSFTKSSYNLDEETDDVTSFAGQEVTKTTVKGAVTYSIKDGSADIITSLNSSTGAVVLNGDCGTATIVATAAYAEEEDKGIITPYPALSKEYTVTVRPRYMVTFSVNGVETVLRQAKFGASIAVPTPSDFGDYKFIGWSTSTVAPTDDEPSMTDLDATVTPENNNGKYYAVYAQERTGGEEEVTSTLNLKQTEPSQPQVINGVSWSWSNVTFTTGNAGMLKSKNATVTFTLPVSALNAKKIQLTCPGMDWGGDANVVLKAGSTELASMKKDGSYTFTSSDNEEGTYTMSQTASANAWINSFTLTYAIIGTENFDYRTSLPNVEVTISESKFLSFCYGSKLDFTETDVKAYKASVNAAESKVTLTKVDVVPAGEGVILYCETAGTYAIPVTEAAASDVTGNAMKGVLERTQVLWNPETNVYNYILQQGQFNKATDGYLKPNRAYLQTSYNVDAEARALEIVFDEGETTGITNANVNLNANDKYFNLNGQRVATPVKGNIYIVNGKKVMFK